MFYAADIRRCRKMSEAMNHVELVDLETQNANFLIDSINMILWLMGKILNLCAIYSPKKFCVCANVCNKTKL